ALLGVSGSSASILSRVRVTPRTSILPPAPRNASMSAAMASWVIGVRTLACGRGRGLAAARRGHRSLSVRPTSPKNDAARRRRRRPSMAVALLLVARPRFALAGARLLVSAWRPGLLVGRGSVLRTGVAVALGRVVLVALVGLGLVVVHVASPGTGGCGFLIAWGHGIPDPRR